jgi:hypothetical protein
MGENQTHEECTLNREDFVRWIKEIYQTRDAEIECNQLQELLPAFVDAEVRGMIMNGEGQSVRLHLSHCPDCTDVYENLRSVVALTENGRLPSADELFALLNIEPTLAENETAEALVA